MEDDQSFMYMLGYLLGLPTISINSIPIGHAPYIYIIAALLGLSIGMFVSQD